MFDITSGSEFVELGIALPVGKTNVEILEMAREGIKFAESSFFGKHVKVYGRCTVPLAAWLGHKLAHVCKSLAFFDPKDNVYVEVASHGPLQS